MRLFMWKYTDPGPHEFNSWQAASQSAAQDLELSDYCAWKLC